MTSAIMLLRALSKLTRSRIYTGNFFHLIYSASSLRKGKKKVQLATRVTFFLLLRFVKFDLLSQSADIYYVCVHIFVILETYFQIFTIIFDRYLFILFF